VSFAQTSKVDSASVFSKKKVVKKTASLFTLDTDFYPASTVSILQQCIMQIKEALPFGSRPNFTQFMDEGMKVSWRNDFAHALQQGGLAIPIGH
jgi:hypothetical protein